MILMAPSKRTVGILISILVSAGFISAAFYFSSGYGPNTASATSTEELLRAYAALDTDTDGLFDWQESLYGADPKNPHSLDPLMTDREAVDSGKVEPKFKSNTALLEETYNDEDTPGIAVSAGTLTDRFGRALFENYLSGKGSGTLPTEDALLSFIDASVDDLLSEGKTATRYNSQHVHIAQENKDSLLAYAIAAEGAGESQNTSVEKSELFYFAEAVQTGNMDTLASVRLVSSTYGNMAAALITVPAPGKLVHAHLRTTNALARMSVVVGNMGAFDTDPLLGLVGLSAYEETVLELLGALNEFYTIYTSENIILTAGEPGARFYQIIESAHERSQK